MLWCSFVHLILLAVFKHWTRSLTSCFQKLMTIFYMLCRCLNYSIREVHWPEKYRRGSSTPRLGSTEDRGQKTHRKQNAWPLMATIYLFSISVSIGISLHCLIMLLRQFLLHGTLRLLQGNECNQRMLWMCIWIVFKV